MRLKNVPGAREAIGASPYVVQNPEQYRRTWSSLFGNSHPIYIEIGMGKGKFLTEMAAAHPQCNFLGIEKFSSVLVRAVQKQAELQLPNLFLVRMNAEAVEEIFGPGEVGRIYLNFSDPWPKERHAKRRLTSTTFLNRYRKILAPGGVLEFKTDNQNLFTFSLESVQEAGWELLGSTRDLHRSEMGEGNVLTEYEARFSQKGNPICKLIARPKETPSAG